MARVIPRHCAIRNRGRALPRRNAATPTGLVPGYGGVGNRKRAIQVPDAATVEVDGVSGYDAIRDAGCAEIVVYATATPDARVVRDNAIGDSKRAVVVVDAARIIVSGVTGNRTISNDQAPRVENSATGEATLASHDLKVLNDHSPSEYVKRSFTSQNAVRIDHGDSLAVAMNRNTPGDVQIAIGGQIFPSPHDAQCDRRPIQRRVELNVDPASRVVRRDDGLAK